MTDFLSSFSARRFAWILGLAVFLIPCVVYWPTLNADFVQWDDDINIYDNPHLRAGLGESVSWAISNTDYVRRYMPLGWLGWILHVQLDGMAPTSYHLGNVLLHAFNALLMYWLASVLLRTALGQRESLVKESRLRLAAAATALLWALHPLRVEVVAWSSGRLYAQASCFLLASFLCYLRHGLDYRDKNSFRHGWYGASVVLFAASLLTYPIGMFAVIGFLVIDVYPLRLLAGRPRGWVWGKSWRVLLAKVPFASMAAGMFLITLWARSRASGDWKPPASLESFGMLERIMQAFYVWAIYVGKTILPGEMSPLYTDLFEFNPLERRFLLCLLTVLALTSVALWWRRRKPAVCWVWVIYLFLLVPMLGLTEHPHYASDRYSYVALIPLYLGLAGWLGLGLVSTRQRWVAQVGVVGVMSILVFWTGLTRAQTKVWQDTPALFHHMIACLRGGTPTFDLYHRLGTYYLRVGRFADAEQAFLREMEFRPGLPRSWRQLGNARACQGRYLEAADAYQQLLEVWPNMPGGKMLLGLALLEAKQFSEAERWLAQAAKESQTSSWQLQEALGRCWLGLGDMETALKHFDAALEADPGSESTLRHKAECLVAQGKTQDALDLLRETRRHHPNSLEVIMAMARVVAADPNLRLSQADGNPWEWAANVEARLGQEHLRTLETKAFAYAGERRMQEAAAMLRKAMSLIEDEEEAKIMQARLDSWENDIGEGGLR